MQPATTAFPDATLGLNADDPRSLRRLEDDPLLRGRAGYVADLPTPALHAVFVRSPHAHAAIHRVDGSAARTMPGVQGVFDAAALHGLAPLPCAMVLASVAPLVVPPRPALATGRVRHVGEAVALVLATTLAEAMDAAEHVTIEYEALPAVTDPAAALQPDAPLLWPEAPGNLAYRFQRGDPAAVAAAFAEAAHTVALDLVNNRVLAASLETRGLIAEQCPHRRAVMP